jgi:amine acid ABC transporter, permease protein, 3-TM region, His/Glu/Gln/Arg/opine family
MGRRFDAAYVFDFLLRLLEYFQITMFIVAASFLLGMLVGFLVALPRLYRIPVLDRCCAVYVSFFRGTPILAQLFLIYFGLPEWAGRIGLDLSRVPALAFVILTYALNTGAFVSEAIRAGVGSVDRGQVEAAYAVGMTARQAFVRIVLPQALAVSLPVLANLVIGGLKDSSLAFTVGVMEMTGRARTLGVATQHFIEAYIALSVIYYAVSLALERGFRLLERRMLRHEPSLAGKGGRG